MPSIEGGQEKMARGSATVWGQRHDGVLEEIPEKARTQQLSINAAQSALFKWMEERPISLLTPLEWAMVLNKTAAWVLQMGLNMEREEGAIKVSTKE